MAKTKRTTMEAAAAAVAAVAAAQDEIDADAALDLEAHEVTEDLLEGLRRFDTGGNRVTWYVYSDSPGKKGESEGYVEKLRTEQLDESRFKSKYGPGEYRVVGRTKDGGYVKGSHKTIRISDILADEPRTNGGGGGDLATYMREMSAAEEQRRKQRSEDIKTYATVFAPSLATIVAALISRRPSVDIAALVTAMRPTQAPPTLGDMTTALVNLKAIQGDGGGGPLEIALKVLEKVQDMPQGGGGSDAGWMGLLRDVIREVAPHTRELLTQIGQPRPPAGTLPASATSGPAFGPGTKQAALPAATPAAAPQPQPDGAAAPPSESDQMWAVAEPWLQLQASNLHAWAASNLEVELVAEMLIKSVPKKFWLVLTPADVIKLLQRPEWWERLIAFHSPLTPYQAWCDDVREELIAVLAEEPAAPHNPETAPQ